MKRKCTRSRTVVALLRVLLRGVQPSQMIIFAIQRESGAANSASLAQTTARRLKTPASPALLPLVQAR